MTDKTAGHWHCDFHGVATEKASICIHHTDHVRWCPTDHAATEAHNRRVEEAVALITRWIQYDYGDPDFDTSEYTDVRPFVESYYAAKRTQ